MTTLLRPEPSWDEAERIRAFWNDNYEALLKRFPDQFVAVKDGEVAVSDQDLVNLVAKLREAGLDPRTDVDIEYIGTKLRTLLL